jgi:hypothetical protein
VTSFCTGGVTHTHTITRTGRIPGWKTVYPDTSRPRPRRAGAILVHDGLVPSRPILHRFLPGQACNEGRRDVERRRGGWIGPVYRDSLSLSLSSSVLPPAAVRPQLTREKLSHFPHRKVHLIYGSSGSPGPFFFFCSSHLTRLYQHVYVTKKGQHQRWTD